MSTVWVEVFGGWQSPLGTISCESGEWWVYPHGAATEPRGPYVSLEAAKHAAAHVDRHHRSRA